MPYVNPARLASWRRGAEQTTHLRTQLAQVERERNAALDDARNLRAINRALHDHCTALEQRLAYLQTCNEALDFELAMERGLPLNPNATIAALPTTAGCEK